MAELCKRGEDKVHMVDMNIASGNDWPPEQALASALESGHPAAETSDFRVAMRLTGEQLQRSLVVLDTNDDVARLVQVINDCHCRKDNPGGCTPVLSAVDEWAFASKPSVGAWLIGACEWS